MNNIKTTVKKWGDITFLDGLNMVKSSLNDNITDYAFELLDNKKLNLSKENMTGWSFEGLPKTEESSTFKVRFSDVFHGVVHDTNFNPSLYICGLIKGLENLGYDLESLDIDKVIGFIARGLRSFTSFIREPALANQLEYLFNTHNISASFNQSAEQDAKDHTDILINANGKVYRLWIYQLSSRGLPHDIDRVLGRRGALLSGIHVMCPLISEGVTPLSAIRVRINKRREKLVSLKLEIENIKTQIIKSSPTKLIKLEERELKLNIEIKNLIQKYDEIESINKNFVDVINGFYFYPDSYAYNLFDQMITGSGIIDYSEIQRVLSEPERLLSKNTIFIV
jgi:hypothetical protein